MWRGFVSVLLNPEYSAGYLLFGEKWRVEYWSALVDAWRRKSGFPMINVVGFAMMAVIEQKTLKWWRVREICFLYRGQIVSYLHFKYANICNPSHSDLCINIFKPDANLHHSFLTRAITILEKISWTIECNCRDSQATINVRWEGKYQV